MLIYNVLWLFLGFVRSEICLNGKNWNFSPSYSDTPANIVEVKVPSTWTNREFLENIDNHWWKSDIETNFNGWNSNVTEGRYFKKFYVPSEWKSKGKIILRFARISPVENLEINSKKIGFDYFPVLPLEIDITDFVSYGEYNRMNIFTKKTDRTIEHFPHSTIKRFYQNLAGIQGDVFLCLVPYISIENALITTDLSKRVVNVNIEILNSLKESQKLTLQAEISFDSKLEAVQKRDISVNGSESLYVTFNMKIAKPNLWGFGRYGKPVLYKLTLRIFNGEKLIDVKTFNFGFREIKRLGNKIILNGKELYIIGDNIGSGIVFMHTQNPFWIRNFIKAETYIGINFVRLHTFIPPEYWVSEFDKYGLLLEVEIPFSNDSIYNKAQKRIINYIVRQYFNHPSIIFWGIDNETFSQGKNFVKNDIIMIKDRIELIENLDSTRLIDAQGDFYLYRELKQYQPFSVDVVNFHPYGNLSRSLSKFSREINFKNDLPFIVGEIYDTSIPKWINKISTIHKTKLCKYYIRISRYWRKSIEQCLEKGCNGFGFHSIFDFAFWGPIKKDSLITGPYNFTGSNPLSEKIHWKTPSGVGAKPDFLYLWFWHGSQIDISFQPQSEVFGLNLVGKEIKLFLKEKFQEFIHPEINKQEIMGYIIKDESDFPYVCIEDRKKEKQVCVEKDKRGKAFFYNLRDINPEMLKKFPHRTILY